MISLIKKQWPLILAIAILWMTIAILLQLSIKQNGGQFTYALDDTYIHMAIAKNVALHGVWGISKYGFTSSSSSPLWTLILSITYMLFGVRETIPFILNLAVGTIALIVFGFLLTKFIINPLFRLAVLLVFIFAVPLPTLIFCGIEHTMHLLFTLLVVYYSAKLLSSDKPNLSIWVLLAIFALLFIMTRYEGLFLLFTVCCLFIINKKPSYALLLGCLGLLPIVVYGIWSISQGWYFLPSSVLLKGRTPNVDSLKGIVNLFGFAGYNQIGRNPQILLLLIFSLFAAALRIKDGKRFLSDIHLIMLTVFFVSALLHMQFALAGRFYRYEGYLMGVGIFAISAALYESIPQYNRIKADKYLLYRYFTVAILLLLAISPLVVRGLDSTKEIPQATKNIFDQQYQLTEFVDKYYRGKVVALNDIGAINYYTDIRCLDLWGLGNMDVSRSKRNSTYNPQRIAEISSVEHAVIAIVYDSWFNRKEIGGLPPEWTKVGQWKISDNVICGDDVVSFYAVQTAEINTLKGHLKEFSPILPSDVEQSGMYIN